MNVYLVGGAVRDELIGRKIKEKDWVVVGSTEDVLLAKRFKKINSQFPVFLHPETKEEYALARKEKKYLLVIKDLNLFLIPRLQSKRILREEISQ